MSKEKQIEEMAKVMAHDRFCEPNEYQIRLFFRPSEALYNAGYRKQSENMVEVVRCKDCVHASSLYSCGEYMCKKGCGAIKTDNDFCSYGAKMKGGAEE